jgi:hypothetical protein
MPINLPVIESRSCACMSCGFNAQMHISRRKNTATDKKIANTTDLLSFVAVNFQRFRHELSHMANIDGGNAGQKRRQQGSVALTCTGPGKSDSR